MKRIIFILFLLMCGKIYCQDLSPMQMSDSVYIWLTTGEYDKIEKHWDQSSLADAKITNLAEQLSDMWEALIMQYGNFEYITDYAELDSSANGVLIVRNIVFENDSLGVKVNVNKNNNIIGLFIVPAIILNYVDAEYVDTSLFEEFDIAFAESENITGKITIPKNINKKVSAIILVHGSGPADLDESIAGRKPFRDIAYGLSSNGVAVLRYNKRTYLGKIKDINNFTIDDESVDDAVAAVEFIKNNYADKIDKIYVLGHSQGGYVMPRIAKKSKTATGFISIGGAARPLPELVKDQYNYLNDLFGIDENVLNEIMQSCDLILSGEFTKDTPDLLFNTPASFWLDLKNYNPVKEFQNEKRPILFIHCGRDYQVTIADFELWQAGLSKNKNCKFVTIDDLNHLMQEGEGRSVPSEYQIPINVSKKIIDSILEWLENK